MPIQPTATRVTVTGAATLIAQNPGTDRVDMDFMARNTDVTLSIFVGDSAVTTSTGFEVKPSEAIAFGLTPGQVMYAVSAGSVVTDVVQRVAQ